MDRIQLLQERRRKLLEAGGAIRADIEAVIDKDSLVELASFSYSESEFYDGTAEGEGVVCGFATIDGCPYYIVAQNSEVLSGGISKANCAKIAKCLEQAEKNGTSVIYFLSTQGVRVGEGVSVLEGIADLLIRATRLKSSVTQYLIVDGDVYGQIAILAGICDFNFFVKKKSVLALNSPLVISASAGVNLKKEEVGGAAALTKSGLVTFEVNDLVDVKAKISALNECLNVAVSDFEDLNAVLPALSKKCDAKALVNVFDKGSALELFANSAPDVKCYLARIGGISVAAAVFDGGADGVKICPCKLRKLIEFAKIASMHNIPYVTFVNTLGAVEKLEAVNKPFIKELSEYIEILDCMSAAKISVVYGKAIGLGYTLFAAKSLGYDFVYAFANSKIALFDDVQGAEIEFSASSHGDVAKLEKKYADENSDPINAAKGGYVDNIIDSAFVKQYLIASLQMLVG